VGRNRFAVKTKEFFMTEGSRTIIYPVKDLAQAKKLSSKLLGVEPYAEESTMLALNLGIRI
jgi:hypothetical protein